MLKRAAIFYGIALAIGVIVIVIVIVIVAIVISSFHLCVLASVWRMSSGIEKWRQTNVAAIPKVTNLISFYIFIYLFSQLTVSHRLAKRFPKAFRCFAFYNII